MSEILKTLDADGLLHFKNLRPSAVHDVTARFYATHGSIYQRFGQQDQDSWLEDLTFHLEFLHPVLEFGFLQPMVDYLSWLAAVLSARNIPEEHLAQSIDWFAAYFAKAMAPAEAVVVVAALHAARQQFLATCQMPPAPPLAPEAWPESPIFENALLSGNELAAMDVVIRALDRGKSLIDIEMHIITPALYIIGEKWQANQVSVAQEHMATAIVQSVMTVALLRSPPPLPINKRILLACVAGNHHTIGLRMVADAFMLNGWEVQYIGADVPTTALVQQVAAWKPDLLGLSIAFPQQLRIAKNVISGLSECLGNARPAVIIGGLAINRFNQLSTVVGADGTSANAQAALSAAQSLHAGEERP
jgi:methanogenic corrinoid protein MtbC1